MPILSMFSLFIVIILCQGISTNAWTKAKPRMFSPSCQCAKGERGEKGDPGICPANCISRDNSYSNDCLGSHIKLQHLAQSIRQLIIDTKQIANRNARTTSCTCSASSPPSTATTTISTRLSPSSIDYNMYMRLKGDKGDKGDAGISCISNCQQSTQLNIRIFPTIEAATDAYHDYPDHTYVHIVNEQGRLQSVLIRIHRRLVPLGLETEHAISLTDQILPTTVSIPKPKCTITLPCSKLHIFALGPRTRRMCNPNRPNKLCSKLSDYDSLCERISERYHLTGFYRAFMSSSTQWLANLFDGVCINPKIINMNEQVLFDTFEEIFERKSPQNVILDVQGSKPQFEYWWHGSFSNGTASSNTCLDWSRQNSSISGIASRLPNGMNGLFDHEYLWPCSINDSNMGILCIETNCEKRIYYRH